MRKGIAIILSLSLAMQFFAQNDGKQKLIKIFNKAEQCYLMDDYQQLNECLNEYVDTFMAHQNLLGDSIDVYRAYYAKMCGSFYYGIAEEDSCDYYSEKMYRIGLNIFDTLKNVTNAMVLHEELAQLYYKMKK